MRIGIDLVTFGDRAGGIGQYAYHLVRSLTALNPGGEYILFPGRLSQPIDFSLPDNFTVVKNSLAGYNNRLLRANVLLPLECRRLGLEVFHSLETFCLNIVRQGQLRTIGTVHDLVPLLLPETMGLRHRLVFRLLARCVPPRADVLLTVSQHTKRDVIQYLKVKEDKVRVLYPGCDRTFHPQAPDNIKAVLKNHHLPSDYLLFVGTLEPRKNIPRLLRAYHLVRHRVDIPLVIVGRRGWLYEPVFRTLRELRLRDRVIFTDFVPRGDLPALYSGALAFIFPSLYEGFGFPVLEAMACGVPVVTSNVASLPEITGHAALLVDPADVQALAAAIEEVVARPGLRQEMREEGLRQAAKFCWERTAREVASLYAELA